MIAQKSGITEEILVEEIKRGIQALPQEEKVSEKTVQQLVPKKEKLERELIALVAWKKMHEKEEVVVLNLPYDLYPSHIIEETVFFLEKTVHGDVEKVLRDLISSYKKEMYTLKLAELQEKMRQGGEGQEEILKEMYELSKLHHS